MTLQNRSSHEEDSAARVSSPAHSGSSMPVFVVDPELSVLERNAAARDLLQERRGLSLVAGQLRLTRPEEHEALLRTIGRIIGRAALSVDTCDIEVSGDPPLRLRVRALAGGRTVARASRVAVYVLDPRHHASVEQLLRRVYGFSPAEAAIVRELLDGRSVPGIAESLNVPAHAVRRQLTVLFEKTATKSEAELAARIVASLAVIR